MKIEGRYALVTCSTSGLGAATVSELVRRGAHVVILNIDATQGGALARTMGVSVEFIPVDISDESAVVSAIAQVAQKAPRASGL